MRFYTQNHLDKLHPDGGRIMDRPNFEIPICKNAAEYYIDIPEFDEIVTEWRDGRYLVFLKDNKVVFEYMIGHKRSWHNELENGKIF